MIRDKENDIINETDIYNIIELTGRIIEYVAKDNDIIVGELVENYHLSYDEATNVVREEVEYQCGDKTKTDKK